MPASHKSLVERLKAQMRKKQINARELAEKAAVGRSFVYDIMNGKSLNPTTKKLSAIANVLGVSVSYLIHGAETSPENLVFPEGVEKNDEQIIFIPVLEVEATKGGNALVTDESKQKPYYFRKSWVEEKIKSSPEDLRIVFVSGDSMEPTLAEGDMLLINTKRVQATPPGIFVIFDGQGLLVKRLEAIPGGSGGTIRVMSDNQQYQVYEAKPEELRIIGRVVWFAREL